MIQSWGGQGNGEIVTLGIILREALSGVNARRMSLKPPETS